MRVFARSLETAVWDKKDADLIWRQHTVLGVGHTEEKEASQDPTWRSTGLSTGFPWQWEMAHSHVP